MENSVTEKTTIYNRKNQPVIFRKLFGNLYERLEDGIKPTGDIINLKVALETRAYFDKPKKEKKGAAKNV